MEPILERAKKISCFKGIVHIESFSSIVIQLSKRERRSASIVGTEEVKTLLKSVVKQFPISCRLEDQELEGSFKKSIAFLRLLIIVDVWKNLVFRSLQVSHVSLDLFPQRDSS